MNMTRRPRFWRSWPVFLLAGPVIWISHFFVVYLFAEAACTGAAASAVRAVTLVGTAIAVAAILVMGLRTRRAFTDISACDSLRQLYFLGQLLAGLSVVAVLFVGLPATFLQPC